MIASTRPMMRGYGWLQKGKFAGHMSPGMFYALACFICCFCLCSHTHTNIRDPLYFFVLSKKLWSLWEHRTLSEGFTDQYPRHTDPRVSSRQRQPFFWTLDMAMFKQHRSSWLKPEIREFWPRRKPRETQPTPRLSSRSVYDVHPIFSKV